MEKIAPQELVVERLRLIDLDRHILNTETFHMYIREAAWDVARISAVEIDAVKAAVEEQGESLHTDELLLSILEKRYVATAREWVTPDKTPQEVLDDIFTWVDELCEDDHVRNSLFLPGAREFIEDLERAGEFDRGESMFFTFGSDPLQKLKLRAIGCAHHPVLITEQKDKGPQIASARMTDGYYTFVLSNGTSIKAQRIELYDDKAPSFWGLPSEAEGVVGFWKLPDNYEPLLSQIGEVPENVTRVNTFPNVDMGSAAIRLVRR